jgi:hypothetical protein
MTKLPAHYQDGGSSVEFYGVREKGGPGTPLEGDIEFYLTQARKTGSPILDLPCGGSRFPWHKRDLTSPASTARRECSKSPERNGAPQG